MLRMKFSWMIFLFKCLMTVCYFLFSRYIEVIGEWFSCFLPKVIFRVSQKTWKTSTNTSKRSMQAAKTLNSYPTTYHLGSQSVNLVKVCIEMSRPALPLHNLPQNLTTLYFRPCILLILSHFPQLNHKTPIVKHWLITVVGAKKSSTLSTCCDFKAGWMKTQLNPCCFTFARTLPTRFKWQLCIFVGSVNNYTNAKDVHYTRGLDLFFFSSKKIMTDSSSGCKPVLDNIIWRNAARVTGSIKSRWNFIWHSRSLQRDKRPSFSVREHFLRKTTDDVPIKSKREQWQVLKTAFNVLLEMSVLVHTLRLYNTTELISGSTARWPLSSSSHLLKQIVYGSISILLLDTPVPSVTQRHLLCT